jgi:2-hydroxycyclohexanecarboxyl-CoA dehydrogenase
MGLVDMQGKVTLVTGGARGIGRGIVMALAGAGASVAIADLRADLAEQTASEVARDTGTHVVALKTEVANLVEVQEMTERVLQTFGKIDVLINNAGWDELKPFLQTTPDFWEKIIAINYRSVLNTCYAVLPHMVTRKAGAVISISSDAGRVGSMGEAVYAGTKAAIIAFSRTLAREHAREYPLQRRLPWTDTDPPSRGDATAGIWQPGAGTHGAVYAAEAPGKIGRCRPDSSVFSF